jgi:endonuclease/exonuclease/phosphatase family metal-dependent hydrolase
LPKKARCLQKGVTEMKKRHIVVNCLLVLMLIAGFSACASFSPSGGLDKIFCRGGLEIVDGRRCRLRVSKVASDHLAVIADIKVKM